MIAVSEAILFDSCLSVQQTDVAQSRRIEDGRLDKGRLTCVETERERERERETEMTAAYWSQRLNGAPAMLVSDYYDS